MKAIGYALGMIIGLIALPFVFLYYLFIGWPVQFFRVIEWRNNVRRGDSAYRLNDNGSKTYGTIFAILDDKVASFKYETPTGYQNETVKLSELYPVKEVK